MRNRSHNWNDLPFFVRTGHTKSKQSSPSSMDPLNQLKCHYLAWSWESDSETKLLLLLLMLLLYILLVSSFKWNQCEMYFYFCFSFKPTSCQRLGRSCPLQVTFPPSLSPLPEYNQVKVTTFSSPCLILAWVEPIKLDTLQVTCLLAAAAATLTMRMKNRLKETTK